MSVETGPILLISDAPLDRHTANLLREFTPTDEIVTDAGTTAQTLRQWARAARGCSGRLVVVDAQLRAEASALGKLLDAPGVGTAALLMHSGDDAANPRVQVHHGDVVADDGSPAAAAGIFVVQHEDCPAFARAVDRAAENVERAGTHAGGSAWQLALAALVSIARVQAVPAAPFCASRVAMDLPDSSEEERRLRATAGDGDDPIVHIALRPLSRHLTRRALAGGRSSEQVTLAGLGAGLVAALLAAPGGRASWLLASAALVAATILLLSDGEVARYRRRSSSRGGRLHRVVTRVVEIAFIFGLAVATARAGTPAWLLTTAAIGLLAALASAVATRAAVGDVVPDFRTLRWLVGAATLAVAGPGYALLALAFGALAVLSLVTVRALGDAQEPTDSAVDRSGRFLHPPGSFTDSGVLVRLGSTAAGGSFQNLAGRLFGGGVALIGLTTVWSWGANPWPMLVGAVVFVIATALAFTGPLRGTGAWSVPPILRGVEMAVLIVVASTTTAGGRVAAALAMAGVYLVTTEATDRWRFHHAAPPAWLPLLSLGFDGRILVIAGAGVIGAATGATAMWFVAVLLIGLWATSLAVYPWRQPSP